MLVACDDGLADRGADGVPCNNGERIAVGGERESLIGLEGKVLLKLAGENLRPDGAGDGVAEGGADVVCCPDVTLARGTRLGSTVWRSYERLTGIIQS